MLIVENKSSPSDDQKISTSNQSDIFEKVPDIFERMPPKGVRKVRNVLYLSFWEKRTRLIIGKDGNIYIDIVGKEKFYFSLENKLISEIVASCSGHDKDFFFFEFLLLFLLCHRQ